MGKGGRGEPGQRSEELLVVAAERHRSVDERHLVHGPPDLGALGLQAHQAGELHRAISVLVVNSAGQMLLQKRASSK